jgi:hypothetical protein
MKTARIHRGQRATMHINIDNEKIDETLVKKIRAGVRSTHNYVEIRMENISRRVWKGLLTGLQAAEQFEENEQETGSTYFLRNGSVARRFNTELSMCRSENVQNFKLRPSVRKRQGVFADLPGVTMQVETRSVLDPAKEKSCKVNQWQYSTRHVFVNTRGYEYVLSIATPCGTLDEAEEALTRAEQQKNTFSVRFALTKQNHACFYHAINCVNLFLQVFNEDLDFRLS